jgi:histidine kinase
MVLSHVAVAVIALLAFYLVISLAVPALFDRGVAHGTPTGRGPGQGLRAVVSAAVTQAALLGGGIAAAAAVALADVNSMGERLAQTERTRVQLIGDVAHEMRTPLTVIDGYVEGMIDGVIEVTPETLGELGTETRRLRRLAEDFSSLSRAEERRFDLRAEPVDLADLVSGAAERLRPQTEEKDVTLTVEVPPLPVVADPDRILQVVTNLVGNAIAATPSGGWIRVSGRREGDRALVNGSSAPTRDAPAGRESG